MGESFAIFQFHITSTSTSPPSKHRLFHHHRHGDRYRDRQLICAQSQSQKQQQLRLLSVISPITVTSFSPLYKRRVVSDHSTTPFIVKSAGEEIAAPEDTGGGGDGFGSTGGGGGGGDKYNNNGGGESEEESNNKEEEKKKLGMSMSQKLTLGYAALIGVGGVMGYLKSGSQKSLMAGGLSTLLLYYVYAQLPTSPLVASSVGLGLSAALLGVMGSRFKKSGKIFPAGVVSLVSLVMSGGYLHGIVRSMH